MEYLHSMEYLHTMEYPSTMEYLYGVGHLRPKNTLGTVLNNEILLIRLKSDFWQK